MSTIFRLKDKVEVLKTAPAFGGEEGMIVEMFDTSDYNRTDKRPVYKYLVNFNGIREKWISEEFLKKIE